MVDIGRSGDASKALRCRALQIMWFMFYDNNNHQFTINDMYTSFNRSGREDYFVRGSNGSCAESIERSAFNRWVSTNCGCGIGK